jgi:hypothetical protein
MASLPGSSLTKVPPGPASSRGGNSGGRSSVAAKGALGCAGQTAGVCGDGQGLSRRRQDGEIRAREAENVVGRGGEAVLRDEVEARLAVRLGLGGEAAGQSVSRHAAAPTDGVAEDWAGRTDAARPRVRGQDQRARVDLPDAATVQWPLPGAPA